MIKHWKVEPGLILMAALAMAGCESGMDAPGNRPASTGTAAPVKTAAAAEATARPTATVAKPVHKAKPPAAKLGEDWNDAGIDWVGYEEGLTAAKAQNKPVCLVFFTHWCPHCKNYSRVFKDPRVEKRAKGFVMIRLDNDKHPEVSKKYAVDGNYIPRTFFLRPDGTLDESIQAPRARYRYFYDERKADDLLASMSKAEKLK